MTESAENEGGFEAVFLLVGGHGRFQYLCLALWSLQLMEMTWNDLGYIFLGAVPSHWCHIPELEGSSWTEDQIRNISIPKTDLVDGNWKYDQCQYLNYDYSRLLDESQGNFEAAYDLVHYGDNSAFNASPITKSCQVWTYDRSIYKSTIVTSFDLVCDRRYLVASIQAFFMIGALIGHLIFGPLNDKILGRRRAVLLSLVLLLLGGFSTAFSTSYLMFIISRFVVAIGSAGSMQATMSWFLEHCDTKSRAKLFCVGGIFCGLGYAVLPIYAYYIRTWENLQLGFSLTSLSLLSFYWIFQESPRWLASRGRDEEAVQALQKIASVNGIKPPPCREVLLKYVQQCHARGERGETNPSENKGISFGEAFLSAVKNYGALVSTRELRRTSVVIWINFVAVTFVYYGFAFSSPTFATNPYLVVSLGALMEIPASLLPIPFLNWWGRRPSTFACNVLTSVAAFAIVLTPVTYQTTRTLLSMAGKLFVAAAFTIICLVAGEAYPTVVRTTGQGTGEVMGRFGSMAAPFVADMLTTVYPDLPSVIFGLVSLGAAAVALFIPEMKDVDMKDQVDTSQEEDKAKNDTQVTE